MSLPSTAVFAFNTAFKSMQVFDSHADAMAHCPGLEIAEGDWLFFAADGSRLDAVFAVDPVVQRAGHWVMSNGVYDLKPGSGSSLMAFIFNMCRETDGVWMRTFAELEVYFREP